MKLSFNLRKNKINKDLLIPVQLIVRNNGLVFRKNISKVKVLEYQWSNKTCRVLPNKKNEKYNFHIEYNKVLDEVDMKIKAIYRDCLLNNIELTSDLINGIFEKVNSDKNENNKLLVKFQEFIDTNKNLKAKETIKGYKTALNFIRDFEKNKQQTLYYSSITMSFFDEFRNYSFEVKNTKNNYFAKLIATLKTFMTWSYEREYHTNLSYKKFKAPEEDIEVIYLKIEELMTLNSFDFKSNRLNHVRDVYCFGCFTGLRFSDLKQLKPDNIIGNKINITIQKTRMINHTIPLNQFAINILNRYQSTIYYPLPTISSQKFNEYIKECCKEVGINEPTTITRYIGRKRIDKTVPKYELITSHTARKTFVTNSLVLGMNESVVKNITGHKKESSFRKYVKIADDFKKNEMENTWDKI